MDSMQRFQDIIGYSFGDASLLYRALTSPSYANDHGIESYKRLEHLGDSVIYMCVTEYLHRRYPNALVEELTDRRKNIVSELPLAHACDRYFMGDYVKLSKRTTVNNKIKCDVYESVTGAIYLDSYAKHGINRVTQWILASLELNDDK